MASPVLEYPQVNGAKVSFCSLEFSVAGGFQFTGIKAINYDEALETGKVFGNQPTIQGETRGHVTPKGDIELYRDSYEAFLDFLTGGNPALGFSETRFTFTVGYAELGATLTTSDILPFVRFHSPSFSGTEGVEALTVKLQMSMIGQIGWHGRTGHKTQLSPFPVMTG